MKAIYFSSIILVLFCSCQSKTNNEETQLIAMYEALRENNIWLEQNNAGLLSHITDKQFEYQTREKAKLWVPKAERITRLSINLLRYINNLKQSLEEVPYRGNYPDESNHLFDKDEKAMELVNKINQYKTDLFLMDTIGFFSKQLKPIFPGEFDSGKNEIQFVKTFLLKKSKHGKMATLEFLENKIRWIHNQLLVQCNEKLYTRRPCEFPVLILGQSTSIVQPGEEIELTAGIGSFRHRPGSIAYLGNNKLSISNDGVIQYTFKPSYKPGIHSIPFSIKFIDDDGKTMKISKNIKYKVIGE